MLSLTSKCTFEKVSVLSVFLDKFCHDSVGLRFHYYHQSRPDRDATDFKAIINFNDSLPTLSNHF